MAQWPEKFNKTKKGGWHIEKRTRGKREHYERPGSAFRNVSGSGWWAVSVVRSPELPPSFRGPREERGVRGETGSPGPGFDWQRWTVFGQDGLERVYAWGWRGPYAASLQLADDGESDGCEGREWSCWINSQMGTFCRDVEFMNSFQSYRPKI